MSVGETPEDFLPAGPSVEKRRTIPAGGCTRGIRDELQISPLPGLCPWFRESLVCAQLDTHTVEIAQEHRYAVWKLLNFGNVEPGSSHDLANRF